MKAVKFVDPTYEIPKERKTLYTKTIGDGERLDIVAWPLNPHEGTTLTNYLDMAFESVIWNETDLDEEGITDQVMRDWMKSQTLGDLEHSAMEAVEKTHGHEDSQFYKEYLAIIEVIRERFPNGLEHESDS